MSMRTCKQVYGLQVEQIMETAWDSIFGPGWDPQWEPEVSTTAQATPMSKCKHPSKLTAKPRKQPNHRDHVSSAGQVSNGWHSCVARQLTKKETRDDPRAIDTEKAAWDKLKKRTTWALDPREGDVREYDEVISDAKRKKKVINIGRVHSFVVVKHSELTKDKLKLKGRCVFQGNNVTDQTGFAAIF